MLEPGELTECPVRIWADRTPTANAIIFDHRAPLSYREFDLVVDRATAYLKQRGVGEGVRVALVAPIRIDVIALIFACFRIGATAAPLSVRLPPAALQDRVAAISADITITTSDMEVAWSDPDRRDEGLTKSPRSSSWRLDASATIVFTSGSTAGPKGALHLLSNHVYNALGSHQNIPIRTGDRWLLSLPLYHVGGLAILFRCFLAGAAVALPTGEPLQDSISRLKPTHCSLVATQMKRLMQAPDVAFESVKHILLGGSAIPASLIDEAVAHSLPIHTSYGMTEMASQITTTPTGADRRTLASSGTVLPFRELRVRGSHIEVRGKTRFAGYVDHGRLSKPFDSEGWFATGDSGYVDEEGLLHVTGRSDDMFISGGENINPGDIERALTRLHDVRSARVVPVDDDEFGQRPIAFVESDSALEAASISRSLREDLPSYMIPIAYLPMPRPDAGQVKVPRETLEHLASRWMRDA